MVCLACGAFLFQSMKRKQKSSASEGGIHCFFSDEMALLLRFVQSALEDRDLA